MGIYQRSRLTALLVGIGGLAWGGPAGAGSMINGDFASSDLSTNTDPTSGWVSSAQDADGNAVTPLISVETATAKTAADGGNTFAHFTTGTVGESSAGAGDEGPFISTLAQTLDVSVNCELSFDFSFFTETDATGTTSSSGTSTDTFLDVLAVSLGVNMGETDEAVYELLTIDGLGVMLNPFSTAPATVELIDASTSQFDHGLRMDLSALINQDVMLFFDIINVDDGHQLSVDIDNVGVTATGGGSNTGGGGTAVPEPATWMLLGSGLLGLVVWRVRALSRPGR